MYGWKDGSTHVEYSHMPHSHTYICFFLSPPLSPPALPPQDRFMHHAAKGAPGGAANEGRHVRAVYNGSVVDMPCSVRGKETCHLNDFKRMVAKYRVLDFAAECSLP